MTSNRRFCLNEDRYVIDMLNAANTGKVCCYAGEPEDESHLREKILHRRLDDLLDKIIINLNPMETLPSGEKYQPYNEQRHAISWAVFCAIKASQLNSLDPAMSIQHRFGGTVQREIKRTADLTSLSLFRDDVERLLRDLYGDIESEALDSVLRAVFIIVEEFTKYVRSDLCKEHTDAVAMDYMLGIGAPDGCGISNSEFRQGFVAKFDLFVRACEVGANPSAFSEYTVQFAKLFGKHWKLPSKPLEFLSLSNEMKMRWFMGPKPERPTCEIPF